MTIRKEINRICKKVLVYMNEKDCYDLTKEKFVEQQLKQDLIDLVKKSAKSLSHKKGTKQ